MKPRQPNYKNDFRNISEILKAISKDISDIKRVLNIEDELEVSQQFGVMSVPTLLFIPMNDKPSISPGSPSKEQLKELIEDLLDSRIFSS